nr:hypothetical protein [Tanacetum cinerariifolium]
MDRDCQVVILDYFINNDLGYLRGGSSIKVAYDRHVVWGTSYWGPKQQRFYGFPSNRVSEYDVYSTKRIIVVAKLKAMKWYDYGYLEEIEVRREDQQLYKFKEEDLQLGVKIYQKKLNITKPDTFRSKISNRTPYITYNNHQGIIYEDEYKRNTLIRKDELYKFSDGMLTSVRSVHHDIALNLRID